MSAPGPAKERLAFLDVARGLAAALVLLEHCFTAVIPGFLKWGMDYNDVGRVGVCLFLLVSGFIIPVSLEQGGSNARFWLRRFFRLFPAYWFSILVAYVYVCAGAGRLPPYKPWHWWLNLTMFQGFFRAPIAWGTFWTLQLELVIYIACSLLFALGLLRR